MKTEKPIAVTIATLFALMLLSFPAFAGEATHFTFTKTGPLIMRPEGMRPPGPFFTCLVDMRAVDTFPYDFALYFSTDHGRRGGIWLYVCNGIPTQAGNWKSYHEAAAEGGFDYLEHRPAKNPIFVDTTQGSQTETPCVNLVGDTFYMTYHNSGAGHSQSTLLATSTDAVNFTRINGEADSIILDYDPATAAGNGHTGYLRWKENPFPALSAKYMGYALHGGGDDFYGSLWVSDDAERWERARVFASIEGHAIDENRIVRRRALDPNSIMPLGNGEYVAIGSAGERSSGGRKRTLELYEVFLADDGQALTRRARKILGVGPPGSYDTEEVDSPSCVVIDGTWHMIYVGVKDNAGVNTVMGAVGTFDPNAPKSPELKPEERTRDLLGK
jgi:hypothetical protein